MKPVLLLAGLITLSGSALAASQPVCALWDASGSWVAQQGAYRVEFKIAQQRSRIEATASYLQPDEFVRDQWIRVPAFGHNSAGLHSANVIGALQGDSLTMHTQWGAVYTGKIDANGRVEGVTYFKDAPSGGARWYGRSNLKCLVAATPAPAPVPAPVAAVPCRTGFVWREARPSDLVCVTPESRSRVAEENRTAAARVVDRERGGARGQCRPGFVWREAFVGDVVCVAPAIRTLVSEENRLAASRAAPSSQQLQARR